MREQCGEGGDGPPELPPRPPHLLPLSPRPPAPHAPAYSPPTPGDPHHCSSVSPPWYSSLTQKYVLLTLICGGLSVVLGALFMAIYLTVKATTTSLHYFQTIPTYVPAIAMTLTGLMVMIFARQGNRKSCLIKLCGCICLLSSLLCVVVTVTTTVIHMNRLQTLRECVYQSSSRTCTCFAGIMDHRSIDYEATLRFVFAATANCEVIHGTIYSCLRAMFGLSVVGILVSIFSCMLVYQILSHEKKKKYLAELNSRCRGLYQRPELSSLSQHSAAWSVCPSQHHLCPPAWDLQRPCGPGNLYSPTPEVSSVSTVSTTTAGGLGGETREPWRWLQWARKPHAQAQVSGTRPPHWRYSHPDTVYGFRPPGPGIQAARELLSSYSVSPGQLDSLSNLLWGPPPPYEGAPSTSPPPPPPPPPPASLSSPVNTASAPAPARTSRSGLLEPVSSSSEERHDSTLDSGGHIYERLGRRSGSLPTRRRPAPHQLSAITLRQQQSEEQRRTEDLEEISRALAALEQHSTGLPAPTASHPMSPPLLTSHGPAPPPMSSGSPASDPAPLSSSNPGLSSTQQISRGSSVTPSSAFSKSGIISPTSLGGLGSVGALGHLQNLQHGLRLPRFGPVARRTVSSQQLLGLLSSSSNSSSSPGSRASTSSSTAGEGNAVVRTQALPLLSSSIIQTATSQLLSLPPPPRLPPSLTGLVSPRRRNPPPPPPTSNSLLPGLISPSRLHPSSNTSPSLVYLRPEQNIPDSFTEKFRPIQAAERSSPAAKVSSDDIVVTLRSVNV